MNCWQPALDTSAWASRLGLLYMVGSVQDLRRE